jgi:hypothetical protein
MNNDHKTQLERDYAVVCANYGMWLARYHSRAYRNRYDECEKMLVALESEIDHYESELGMHKDNQS